MGVIPLVWAEPAKREITVRTVQNTQKCISLSLASISLEYLWSCRGTVFGGLLIHLLVWRQNQKKGAGVVLLPLLLWHGAPPPFTGSACTAVTAHFQFAELTEHYCNCVWWSKSPPCRNILKEEVEVQRFL